MKRESQLRLLYLALAALFLLLTATPGFFAELRSVILKPLPPGVRMIEALKNGILIVPPTLGSIGMIFVVHHKRNQFKRNDAAESGSGW